MVNLIITLISIALIAIVAVSALYSGGDAFRDGSADATANQLVNAGQQISAANELYFLNENEGSFADISTLTQDTDEASGTKNYLKDEPRLPDDVTLSVDTANGEITFSGVKDSTCESDVIADNCVVKDGSDNVYTF